MTNRLTPDDWIAAGFQALAERGPEALKAEPLARRLKTSKGSFYWHFKDVPAFHAAMLDLWQDKAFAGIVAALEAIPSADEKLRTLAKISGTGAPDRYGGLLVEPAMRAWSLRDARVAEAVARIDAARIDYVAKQLKTLGKPRSDAVLFYSIYVGLHDLQARGGTDAANALSDFLDHLLR